MRSEELNESRRPRMMCSCVQLMRGYVRWAGWLILSEVFMKVSIRFDSEMLKMRLGDEYKLLSWVF